MKSNQAFTAVIDFDKSKVNEENTLQIVVVERDVPGYSSQDKMLNYILVRELTGFPAVEVEKWIHDLNLKYFGLDREESFKIVASSIKAQNIRDSDRIQSWRLQSCIHIRYPRYR